jgi:hypothetical protein
MWEKRRIESGTCKKHQAHPVLSSMDTVTILRRLLKARVLVLLSALVALLVGFAICYRVEGPFKVESRRYDVGVATARLLVDTPSSQVVQVAPRGSDVLGVRANLLANLMVEGTIKDEIAQRARLRTAQLGGVSEASKDPATPAGAPKKKSAYLLTTRVLANLAGDQLPIIEIEAQAPDTSGAANLANAAVTGLRSYLDTKALDENIAPERRLRVTGLGEAQVHEQIRGPSPMLAIIAVLFIFGLLCAGILILPALGRAWYAASTEEYPTGSEPGDWDPPADLFDDPILPSPSGEAAARA